MPDQSNINVPVLRNDEETLKERMSENGYNDILPARYLKKNEDGEVIEEQEELFERVANNIAVAEYVFEENIDEEKAPDIEWSDIQGGGVVDGKDDEAYDKAVKWAQKFQHHMEHLKFMPNTPTLINAGTEMQQLSACFVDSPNDDLQDIGDTETEASLIFQCLTEDAIVETEEGRKSISDVSEGEKILQSTDSGTRFSSVENVFVYDNAPTKSIKLKSGQVITGTPNHDLLVNGEWKEIGDISEDDDLHIPINYSIEEENEPKLQTVPAGAQWETDTDVESIIQLHSEGFSDYEIADMIDSSSSTVHRWRSDKLDLEPNGSGGFDKGQLVSFDEEKAKELYQNGLSDSEIADKLNCSISSIQTFRVRNSFDRNNSAVKEVTQPERFTSELSEMVGLWIGDGSFHNDGVRFHISRDSVKERIEKISENLFGVSPDSVWSGGCYEICIHSHEIKRWWKQNFGEYKTSSVEASVPGVVFDSGKEEIKSFLRGLFTADGGLNRGLYPTLTTRSGELASDVQSLLIRVGIPAKDYSFDAESNFIDGSVEKHLVSPTTETGIRAYAESVGWIDEERSEENFKSVRDNDFRKGQHGYVNENSEWVVPVENIDGGSRETVYDVSVSDQSDYIANDVVSHNSGGGVGYDFGQLRPYGDIVGSTGGIASGPITFMQRYDQNCETIAQGGVRRGAQMGTMQVTHPDVIHFIHAKNKAVSLAHQLRLNDPDDPTYTDFGKAIEEARELIDEEGRVPEHLRNAVEGHLSNFNISVTVTDEFMEALQNGERYTLINPRTNKPHIASEETKQMYEWFDLGDEVTVGEELTLPAEEIWTRIVEGAYENGEPGVMFIDTVNDEHSYDVEKHENYRMTTSNPCAEQNLMEYEACNLGHINLSTIVDENIVPWSEYTYAQDEDDLNANLERVVEDFLDRIIDWNEFNERIEVGTRFLDNVVTMSDFPIDEIEETVRKNRKIGLGIMGLAQLYIQLGVRYGSDVGNEVARQLMLHINHESKEVSHELAKERGSFANWEDSKYSEPWEYEEWFNKHVGGHQFVYDEPLAMRNHNTTTIAPTGTTSRIGNTTGGCEPIYNVAFYKNVTDDIQGDEMLVVFDSLFLKTLEENDIDVDSVKEEAQYLMENNEFDGVEDLETVPDEIGELFVTTGDLDSQEHASVMCALQEGVDSSISKTLNAPKTATLEDAKDTFEYVYENGGKSVTFYRDGSRTKQVNTTRKDNQESSEEGDSDKEYEVPFHREAPDVLSDVERHRIRTGSGKLYVTIGRDEYGPVEVMATVGKSGGETEAFTEALAREISQSLQWGVPITEVIDQLENIKGPEIGYDGQDVVHSVPDGIALALKRYIDGETMKIDHQITDVDIEGDVSEIFDASECPKCGSMALIQSEGCEECETKLGGCGWSKC